MIVKLPVTVIIPTLNCREKLARHLDAIGEWLSCVEEIIAVDSNSTDGTRELLEERLQRHGGQVISTGPGLYKAWNLAASKATQPYLYYSTICDIITRDGITELTHLMEENDLDVVISPPKIVGSDGVSEEKTKWPIHYVLKYLSFKNEVAILDELQKQYMVSAFLPAGIIGSSASNLYRTEVIQKNPFPLDVGTVGDSLWALKNLPLLRVGIARKHYATFCWDGVRNGTWDESGELMEKFKNESLKLEHGSHTIGYINDHLTEECVRLQAAINEYDAYVKFLTRPLSAKVKDVVFKYTSVRFWLGRISSRG
jgi:hypothetical protein